jgi:hypothetical protein
MPTTGTEGGRGVVECNATCIQSPEPRKLGLAFARPTVSLPGTRPEQGYLLATGLRCSCTGRWRREARRRTAAATTAAQKILLAVKHRACSTTLLSFWTSVPRARHPEVVTAAAQQPPSFGSSRLVLEAGMCP